MSFPIPPSRAKQALSINVSGSSATRHQLHPLLEQLARQPHFEHVVRLPASNHFAFENGMVQPPREAAIWLYERQAKGELIGPWDSCLESQWPALTAVDLSADPLSDTFVVKDNHDLLVSFASEEDAVLFRLRWEGVRFG